MSLRFTPLASAEAGKGTRDAVARKEAIYLNALLRIAQSSAPAGVRLIAKQAVEKAAAIEREDRAANPGIADALGEQLGEAMRARRANNA